MGWVVSMIRVGEKSKLLITNDTKLKVTTWPANKCKRVQKHILPEPIKVSKKKRKTIELERGVWERNRRIDNKRGLRESKYSEKNIKVWGNCIRNISENTRWFSDSPCIKNGLFSPIITISTKWYIHCRVNIAWSANFTKNGMRHEGCIYLQFISPLYWFYWYNYKGQQRCNQGFCCC